MRRETRAAYGGRGRAGGAVGTRTRTRGSPTITPWHQRRLSAFGRCLDTPPASSLAHAVALEPSAGACERARPARRGDRRTGSERGVHACPRAGRSSKVDHISSIIVKSHRAGDPAVRYTCLPSWPAAARGEVWGGDALLRAGICVITIFTHFTYVVAFSTAFCYCALSFVRP
jgi:hypothetical protein